MKLLCILSLLFFIVDSAPMDLDALIEAAGDVSEDATPEVEGEIIEQPTANEEKPEDELEQFQPIETVHSPLPSTDGTDVDSPVEAIDTPTTDSEESPVEPLEENTEDSTATSELPLPIVEQNEEANKKEPEPSMYSAFDDNESNVDLTNDSTAAVDEDASASPPASETVQVPDEPVDTEEQHLEEQLASGVGEESEQPLQPTPEVLQEQPLQPLQQLPMEAVPTKTGASATVDGVEVRFVLHATWAVPGGRRRGYTVSITNGADRNVCGVTFMPNTKTTDLFNLSSADDGSLTTKGLRLALDETVNKFGYISFDRSLPTVISVTYC